MRQLCVGGVVNAHDDSVAGRQPLVDLFLKREPPAPMCSRVFLHLRVQAGALGWVASFPLCHQRHTHGTRWQRAFARAHHVCELLAAHSVHGRK